MSTSEPQQYDDRRIPIPINKTWDYRPTIIKNVRIEKKDNPNPPTIILEDLQDHHVLRSTEGPLLIDFICRRSEGALLISGKRGVGKTSALFSSINQSIYRLDTEIVEKSNPDLKYLDEEYQQKFSFKLLPVLINAPDFGMHKRNTNTDMGTSLGDEARENHNAYDVIEVKRSILQNIVRGLFQGAKEAGIVSDDNLTPSSKNIDKSLEENKIPFFRKINFLSGLRKSYHKRQVKKDLYPKDRVYLEDYETLYKDAQNTLYSLYRRAMATEYRREANLEQLRQDRERIERTISTSFKISKKLIGVTAASFVAALVTALYPSYNTMLSTVLGYTVTLPAIGNSILEKILPLLIAILPPVTATVIWETKKSSVIQDEEKNTASAYYRYDYNVSTLESEVREALSKLSKIRYKPIFVIDELDKIDEELVSEAITNVKTLFNQTNALFILITGQDFFSYIVDSDHKNTRSENDNTRKKEKGLKEPIRKKEKGLKEPMIQAKLDHQDHMFNKDRIKEYTLFSQRIFLQRPTFTEMKQFMDEIVLEAEWTMKESEYAIYEKFKNYVCFLCKTDYFELYNVIRDHLLYENPNELQLNIKVEEKLEHLADLQEAMEFIYERKKSKYQSRYYNNDLLLSRLYELVDKLANLNKGTELKISRQPKFKIMFKWNSKIVDKIDGILEQTEQDALVELLKKLATPKYQFLKGPDKYERYFMNKGLTVQEIESEKAMQKREPEKTVDIAPDIPAKISITEPIDTQVKPVEYPSTIHIVKEEKNFVSVFRNFRFFIISYINVYNIHNRFTDQVFTEENFEINRHLLFCKFEKIMPQLISFADFDRAIKFYNGLTKEPPQPFPREDLEQITTVLDTAYKTCLNNCINLIKVILGFKILGIALGGISKESRILSIESKDPQNGRERTLMLVQDPDSVSMKKIDHQITNKSHDAFVFILITEEHNKEDKYAITRDTVLSIGENDKDKITRLTIPNDETLSIFFDKLISAIVRWYYRVPPLKKKEAEILFNRGIILSRLKLYNEAIKCYEEASLIQPDYTDAWYNLGNSHFRLGNYNESVHWFDMVLKRSPNDIEVLNNKASSLFKLGRNDEANKLYDQVLKLNPTFVKSLIGKGICLYQLEEFGEALQSFERALQVEPDNSVAWKNKGLFHSLRSSFGFSRQEEELELVEGKWLQRKSSGSVVRHWDNCRITIANILPTGKTRLIIRRFMNKESSYKNGRSIQIRSMLEIDVTSIPEPPKPELPESGTGKETEASNAQNKRWKFSLNDQYTIWELAKEGERLQSSNLYALYRYLNDFLEMPKLNPNNKFFSESTVNNVEKVLPVIYQPDLNGLNSDFLREIHCHEKENTDGSLDIEVSLIFNNQELANQKFLNGIFKNIRNLVYGRIIDIETFRIHWLRNKLTDNYFEFQRIYSGGFGIWEDTMHGDIEQGIHRQIDHYFIDDYHPIVFINTRNHAMAQKDNNSMLWKWEYVPWLSNSPIILGTKSREELDKEFRPVLGR